MESVSLATFAHPAASRPARVSASLHLPAADGGPFACMVILTSSAGVQRRPRRAPRGGRPDLVSAAQMEGDAFAALAHLRSDPRIDPARIGVMGVSKGAGATLNAAIAVRQRWRTAGNDRIRVKVYSGAHHGWESLGPVFDIGDAENWSCCNNFIEDDGSHVVVAAGRTFSEPDYQAWVRRHRVTHGARGAGGARAAGGTAALKQRATGDLLAFLATHGFVPGAVAKPPQRDIIRGHAPSRT